MSSFNPDVTYEIFKHLNYDQIVQYCQTSKDINAMCKDDRLWEYLYKHHFANIPHIDLGLTWRASYKLTYFTIFNTVNEIVTNVTVVIAKYLKKELLIGDLMQIVVDWISRQTSYNVDLDQYVELEEQIKELALGVAHSEVLASYPYEKKKVFEYTYQQTSADTYISNQLNEMLSKFGYHVDDPDYPDDYYEVD